MIQAMLDSYRSPLKTAMVANKNELFEAAYNQEMAGSTFGASVLDKMTPEQRQEYEAWKASQQAA